MDNDVNAAETLQNRIGNRRAAFSSRDVRPYEQIRIGNIAGPLTGSGEYRCRALAKPRGHRLPNPFCPAGYQDAIAIKFVRIDPEFICSQSSISNHSIIRISILTVVSCSTRGSGRQTQVLRLSRRRLS